MDDLNKLSESLAEWQEHPITERLRQALMGEVQARKAVMQSQWLWGKEVPEARRLALLQLEQDLTDFFEATAEDLIETEQRLKDEH